MEAPRTEVRWYPGPPAAPVWAGELVSVDAGPRRLVAFAVGDRLCALDDRCTHADESLSEVGVVDDGELECCVHRARFDPAPGRQQSLPATRPLGTAQVRVTDGHVEVGIAEAIAFSPDPRMSRPDKTSLIV